MYQTVKIHYPEFSHPDFKWGSLGGALVMLLKDIRPNTKTKVEAFVDHKGTKKQWNTVRTVLSSPKVRDILHYHFKTEVSSEGITFYPLKKREEIKATKKD